jgi:hypothetical protein
VPAPPSMPAKELLIAYKGAEDEAHEQRRITPLSMAKVRRTWYVQAYCHERNGHRTFRLDRMKEIVDTQTGETWSGKQKELAFEGVPVVESLPNSEEGETPRKSGRGKASKPEKQAQNPSKFGQFLQFLIVGVIWYFVGRCTAEDDFKKKAAEQAAPTGQLNPEAGKQVQPETLGGPSPAPE